MSKLNDIFDQLAKDIYAGKIKHGQVSPDMIRATALQLFDGVKKGFDGNVTPDKYNIDQYTTLRKMRENVFVFSGFKDYHQIKEMSLLLTDNNGNIRSFDDFYKDVKQVNETYNKHYLQAEYDHAVSTGTMAAKWDKFKAEADLFPMLRYRALHDGRTRQEHLALDGATYPIGHEFWKTYLPPNGWRCRCDVDQVEKQAIREPKSKPVLKPMFRNNVGVDGVVFPNTHPVFDNDKRIIDVAKQGANVARFSDPDENGYQLVYKSKKGKNVKIHFEHEEGEIKDNFEFSKIICDDGHNVDMPPYLTGQKNKNKKNIDSFIDDVRADYKTPNKKGDVTNPFGSIKGAVSKGNKQLANIVVIKLDKIIKITDDDTIIHALHNSVSFNKTINDYQNKMIEHVWLIYKNKLLKLERDELLKYTHEKKIKGLLKK